MVEDPTVRFVRIDPALWPNCPRQLESEDEGVFEQQSMCNLISDLQDGLLHSL